MPSSMRGFLRQQVRWKKSFIRNIFFTGRFQWRRGIGPTALFYLHLLFVIAAPILAFRHLVWLLMAGAWFLTLLYLCGVFLKGGIWAAAYRVQNPHSNGWVYRPLMSLLSVLVLSWLPIYLKRPPCVAASGGADEGLGQSRAADRADPRDRGSVSHGRFQGRDP